MSFSASWKEIPSKGQTVTRISRLFFLLFYDHYLKGFSHSSYSYLSGSHHWTCSVLKHWKGNDEQGRQPPQSGSHTWRSPGQRPGEVGWEGTATSYCSVKCVLVSPLLSLAVQNQEIPLLASLFFWLLKEFFKGDTSCQSSLQKRR